MTVYNKIFTKILDSSIWLESTTTRLVWLTFIAAMDEDGFVQFASVANLAHRARVTLDEAQAAVACLEGPDPDSSDPENEGRRIEKVPGGWMVLNSEKYRALVTRTISKEQTRVRVARHREKKRGNVTCNGEVTENNGTVTPSDTTTDSESDTQTDTPIPPPKARKRSVRVSLVDETFAEFWSAYPRREAKGNAEKAWIEHNCKSILPQILCAIRAAKISEQWTREGGRWIPHPATWLNRRGWEDELLAAAPKFRGDPLGHAVPVSVFTDDGEFHG